MHHIYKFFFGWRQDDSGQAVLEFALVLPLLVFLLFAIFTIGFWMNAQQLVTQAAYQGARQGSLTNDNGQIEGAIAENMRAIDPNIGTSGLARTTVSISPSSSYDGGRHRGGALTVTIQYKMPFVFASLPDKFKYVNATMVTRMQCDPPTGVICTP